VFIPVVLMGLVLFGTLGRTEWDNMRGSCKKAP
jgi:hypothetical protein